jgi:hypothetical protein
MTRLGEEDIVRADLTATLRGGLEGKRAIRSISITGGDLTGSIEVAGKVGSVTAKPLAAGVVNGNGILEQVDLTGGRLAPSRFTAGAIGAIKGWGVEGTWTGRRIGNITHTGGTFSPTLNAYDAIGSITAKAVTVNSRGWYVTRSQGGRPHKEFVSSPGFCFGEPADFTVNLGVWEDEPVNAKARLGSIKGLGVDVRVRGTLPWSPSLAKVASRKVTFVESCTEGGVDEDGNPILGAVPNNVDIGGTVDRGALSQAE